jgi:SAM-dependent methyltransferase
VLPLRLGSPDQFSAIREFLNEAVYGEQEVCRRLGLGGLHEYLIRGEKPEAPAPAELSDALDVLLQVLLEGNPVNRDLLGGFIPNPVRESMEALGILCADPLHPGQCYSPVALYPVQGLLIASDRWENLDGSSLPIEKDFVFPGIHPLTHDFLELLPPSPCDKFLDLCSGTAIAALLASKRFAGQSWAVDITERSTHFGEFNRLLNQLSNSTVMQGNLYEPVSGMKFDRIVAHPPYVPALEPGPIYADGGEDGEVVTRAVVQGLPRFLEPHGRLYCDTMGVEREGEPDEQRVREWLGADQSAFDILFIAEKTQGPAQFAYRAARNKKGDFKRMDQWIAHMEKLKVKNLVKGLLVIQGKESGRCAFTVRRQKGARSRAAEVEWLRNWESMRAHPSSAQLLLRSRALACSLVELHVVHTKSNGNLAPSKYTFRSTYPFAAEYDCPGWVATLVARCDGKATALEQSEAGKRGQWIPVDLSDAQLAVTVGELVSRGILQIEGFEPPGRRTVAPEPLTGL